MSQIDARVSVQHWIHILPVTKDPLDVMKVLGDVPDVQVLGGCVVSHFGLSPALPTQYHVDEDVCIVVDDLAAAVDRRLEIDEAEVTTVLHGHSSEASDWLEHQREACRCDDHLTVQFLRLCLGEGVYLASVDVD